MPRTILVVDTVSTNRIVLNARLASAGYEVRTCADTGAARAMLSGSLPDLLLLDMSGQDRAALELCADLRRDDALRTLPVIATGGFGTPDDRVAALRAGADDVLERPFDDLILQARIRSLLRARDATEELKLREDTRHALGFAEAPQAFSLPQPIAVITPNADLGPRIAPNLCPGGKCDCLLLHPRDVLSGLSAPVTPALFVIDGSEGVDELDFYRILSELRSRSDSRHAALMVLVPEGRSKRAAMALDLGADDLAPANAAPEELRLRAHALLRRQREAAALRATLKSGLEAAVTDPLTGLYNRRYALPHLERIAAHSRQMGRQFAVMALDLDHFKAINDDHGHAAGDEVLRQVARRLQDNLRPVDLLARIGGEEFLVAMPDTDSVEARQAAERLVAAIREKPFRLTDDRTEIAVTLSIGIRLSGPGDPGPGPGDGPGTPPSETLETMMHEADAALYAAKTAGRDTISLSAA